MVNYNNGKIYKIEPISGGEDGDIYIGSTTSKHLSQRMAEHRSKYKRWVNGCKDFTSSFKLFEKYGVDNCQIKLLELVKVNTKDELLAKEGLHTKSMTCVNKQVIGRKWKQYQQDNRESIAVYQRKYHEDNKEKIKEKLSAKHVCERGITYTFGYHLRHFATKRHINFLQTRTVTENP